MTDQLLENTARTYRELQASIKKLETEVDAVKQQLIQEMDVRQVDILTAGQYTIRYKLYETSRLDTTALKSARPDVYAEFCKAVMSTRFQVT